MTVAADNCKPCSILRCLLPFASLQIPGCLAPRSNTSPDAVRRRFHTHNILRRGQETATIPKITKMRHSCFVSLAMAIRDLRFVGGTLTDLHRVLEGWCDLQSKYTEIKSEPAYDQSEIASTSLLISAANAIHGWTGLAEVCVKRQDPRNSTARRSGLSDAYISNEDCGYIFELKQAWMPMKGNEIEISSGRYSSKLKEAKAQIAEIHVEDEIAIGEEGAYLFGVYLMPTYNSPKGKIKRKALFNNLVQHCGYNFDAFAVFSPALKQKECTRGEHHSCRTIVALALKKYIP